MIQLHDFRNDGFGWVCLHCEREIDTEDTPTDVPSRMFREGEAESKSPALTNGALAKWADPERRTLVCPRCGITERVDIS